MGLADGIVDLVSSGSTLLMNGLRSLGPALRQPGHPRRPARHAQAGDGRAIAAELRTMLEAVIAGRGVKYLMMNAPVGAVPAIEAILPGLESPSVLPLAHEGMVAVHASWPPRSTSIASSCRSARRAPRASSSCPSRSSCHERRRVAADASAASAWPT